MMNNSEEKLFEANESSGEVSEDKYHELIKNSDKLVTSGRFDEGLQFLLQALEFVNILNNKILQVKTLCKISTIYLTKGDLSSAIKYTDNAEELLKCFDYMEGILDVSLSKIHIYYTKHNYPRVREIGNEALRLCGDKYPLYKGMILLTLADAFSAIAEIDEHLRMLQQALECFVAADYLDGKFLVLNNIAGVYADKLQDNEKALKYYLTLKEQSEDNISSLFSILAYVNIGEIYMKELKYGEASIYLSEGLKRAKGALVERLVFYSYCNLIENYINLESYTTAINYFNLAKDELASYPEQGEWIIHYFRVTALLHFIIGSIDDAKSYIKNALVISNNEDSIIHWNTGFVYEMIRLRDAKQEADIIDGIEAVRFILSKYKNPEMILDKAFDYAIELIHSNHQDLAIEFLKDYMNLKYDHDLLKLKYLYIQAMISDASRTGRVKILKNAMDIAVRTNNKKFEHRICTNLGNYYYSEGDYSTAKVLFKKADDIMKNLINDVPEEYKNSFADTFLKHPLIEN